MDAEKRKKMAKAGFSTDPDFKKMVTEGYYVDKSLLLRDIVDDHMKVKLFTRPRRFGKSLNLSMIRAFFEKTGEDTSVYFKDLDIWKCGERYTSEQGKYPVIYLDFKECSGDTFESTMRLIADTLSVEFLRHAELATSDRVEKVHDLTMYGRIAEMSASVEDLIKSLQLLTRMLYAHHGVKPIVLIDEYDAPIQSGHGHKYYDKIVSFMREFLTAGLKGDTCVSFACLTGVLRISKESLFSDLNNIITYSVLDDEYSPYFGFTEEEVKEILDDFGHPEKYEEACGWYDGYLFGNTRVFNPWSVMNYMRKGCVPAPYWVNTSQNSAFRALLRNPSGEARANLTALALGEPVLVPVDENVPYDKLGEGDNVYTLLLMSGYLTKSATEGNPSGAIGKGLPIPRNRMWVTLPNEELATVYGKEVLDYMGSEFHFAKLVEKALKDMLNGEAGSLEDDMHALMDGTVSYMDDGEGFYHGLVTGMALLLRDVCEVKSNREAGDGRYDIAVIPKRAGEYPGIIIEVEYCGKDEDIDERARDGLRQIYEKRYFADMRRLGITPVYKYGMAFHGSDARVVFSEDDSPAS